MKAQGLFIVSFCIIVVLLSGNKLFGQSLTGFSESNISNTTYTSGLNRYVHADVDNSSGKVVYVWTEYDINFGKEVFCSIYDEEMSILEGPFRINYERQNDQMYPVVRVNQEDNSFSVAWSGYNNTTGGDIYVKKIYFNSDFSTVKDDPNEVKVNDIDIGDQIVPNLVFDYQKGELIVGFRDYYGHDGSGSGAYFRRLDYSPSTLTPSCFIGNQVLANEYTTNNQYARFLEINPLTNELISVCQSHAPSGSGYETIKRVFTFDEVNNKWIGGVETRVNSYYNSDQVPSSLTINSNTGNYVISWMSPHDGSGWGTYCSIFDKDHNLIQSNFRVNSSTSHNQRAPRSVWDEASNTIVFFFVHSQSSFSTIKYRIFDGNNNFTAVGSEQNALIPGPENTQNYWAENLFPVINQDNHRIYLPYDVYSNYSGNSIAKARSFQLLHPLLEKIINYASLKRSLDGSFVKSIDNNLYFSYYEEYINGQLNYTIYDYSRSIVMSNNAYPLEKDLGQNDYELDLSSVSLIDGKFYTLEVTTEKNDVYKLKFMYKE